MFRNMMHSSKLQRGPRVSRPQAPAWLLSRSRGRVVAWRGRRGTTRSRAGGLDLRRERSQRMMAFLSERRGSPYVWVRGRDVCRTKCCSGIAGGMTLWFGVSSKRSPGRQVESFRQQRGSRTLATEIFWEKRTTGVRGGFEAIVGASSSPGQIAFWGDPGSSGGGRERGSPVLLPKAAAEAVRRDRVRRNSSARWRGASGDKVQLVSRYGLVDG